MAAAGRASAIVGALALVALAGTVLANPVAFEEHFVAVGSDGLPEGWQLLEFDAVSRPTAYHVEPEDGRSVLRAESERGAAALVRPLSADPQRFSRLSWRWRVERQPARSDPRTKAGDDSAARVCVSFQAGEDRPSVAQRLKHLLLRRLYGGNVPTSSINDVWARSSARGERYRSPYGRETAVVVLRDDTDAMRVWHEESRDVAQDYRAVFGVPAPPLVGIAVMTDADDTGSAAVAVYADLQLRSEPDVASRVP
jgi:hypothetical protein